VAASKEETLASQLLNLKPGQSVSRSRRIPIIGMVEDSANEVLGKLRNVMNNAVGRLRAEYDGTNFRVESVVGLTDNKQALVATVVATRFANDDEGDQDPDI
jgi:hypothetical protein